MLTAEEDERERLRPMSKGGRNRRERRQGAVLCDKNLLLLKLELMIELGKGFHENRMRREKNQTLSIS